jgi:hypothetical protein
MPVATLPIVHPFLPNLVPQIAYGPGLATAGDGGNIFMDIVGAGANPAATAADKVMATYTLPGGFFDQKNRMLNICVWGATASNTNTKTFKILWDCTAAVVGQTVSGGTTIASIAPATTLGSGGCQLEASVIKYGNPGSNTQLATHTSGQAGNVVFPLLSPQALTSTESGPVIIAVTINAATTATDATYYMTEIWASN